MVGSGIHVSPVGDIEVHAVLEYLIIFKQAHKHHFRFHNLVVSVDERFAVRSVSGEVLGREGDVGVFPQYIEVAFRSGFAQASPIGACMLGAVKKSVHATRSDVDLDRLGGFVVFGMIHDVDQPAFLNEELVDAFAQLVADGVVEPVVVRSVQVLDADLKAFSIGFSHEDNQLVST